MDVAEAADAALWIGKEMMECGADSASTEEALLLFLANHNFKSASILLLPKSLLITINSKDGIHTKMKHIGDVHPNFERLSLLYEYVKNPSLDYYGFKNSILSRKRPFFYLSFFGVPLGCSGFGVLLGAGMEGVLSIFAASFIAFFIKHKMLGYGVALMFTNLLSSFFATLGAYIFSTLLGSNDLLVSQAASTFFLIPGIQLINTFEDMLKGHYLNGAARGLRALFLSFGIVFGASLAIAVERSIAWIF